MKGFFGDEDEDEGQAPSAKRFLPAGFDADEPPTAAEEEDADDPLEAYMSGVNRDHAEQVAEAQRVADAAAVEQLVDDDALMDAEEDPVESFLAFKEERKAARRPDEVEYDEEGNPIDVEQDMLALPPVDHANANYAPFKKNVFVPHADTLVDEVAAATFRKVHDIRVKSDGATLPPPSATMDGLGLGYTLTAALKAKFPTPTPIQSQTVTAALLGHDIIGIAKTGSGKTGAFLWPVIAHLSHLPPPTERGSPLALVVAPTRELAKQIYDVCKQWCKVFTFNVVSLFGGTGSMGHITALKQPCEVAVGTPARLIHLIRKKYLRVRDVRLLCMDEADKMLDMGFEPQVRTLCSQLRPDRITLMFSATFKANVQQLARDLLLAPLRINVGAIGAVNADIEQIPIVVNEAAQKLQWLEAKLPQFVKDGSVLIFVNMKQTADELAEALASRGLSVAATHGEKAQAERAKIHFAFKGGNLPILVATDVASRGLDIGEVRVVIQHDQPKNLDVHTHRVGRTGRAGKRGTAYALIGRGEGKFASIVAASMRQADQMIPPQLQELVDRHGGGGGMTNRAPKKKPRSGGDGDWTPVFVAAQRK